MPIVENSMFVPQLLTCKKRILLTKKWLLFGIVVILALDLGCKKQPEAQSNSTAPVPQAKNEQKALAGSKNCRDCHEEFYKLWSTSWHGLAMQPYTAEFAKANLTSQEGDVTIGKRKYQAEVGHGAGYVREIGPNGEQKYPIAHVMGGKNVYYFLTPLERGRLQVLPVAYDVHKKTWYDMAASGVRHFPDRRDEALDWTDRMFSFNTTCFNCHVSELATNYDLAIRDVSYHVGRTGNQLRIVSRAGRRARPRDGCRRGRPHFERHQDYSHQGVHRPANERHVRNLPCQTRTFVDQFFAGRQVFRPLRPRNA